MAGANFPTMRPVVLEEPYRKAAWLANRGSLTGVYLSMLFSFKIFPVDARSASSLMIRHGYGGYFPGRRRLITERLGRWSAELQDFLAFQPTSYRNPANQWRTLTALPCLKRTSASSLSEFLHDLCVGIAAISIVWNCRSTCIPSAHSFLIHSFALNAHPITPCSGRHGGLGRRGRACCLSMHDPIEAHRQS